MGGGRGVVLCLCPPCPNSFTIVHCMRRALLISGTLLVVATAFGVFAWLQQDIQVGTQRTLDPATRPGATTQIGAIGRGTGAWMTSFDRNTGLPKTRFRGDEFTPKGGDQILVDRPLAEFYIGDDRSSVIRIAGKTGLVIIPGQGPRIRADFSSTPTQPPSRGSMRDVTVTYFPTREDLEQNHPQLILTLNNAYFDNETFEIATEDYTDDQGRVVPAREVPVVVRGDTLDFDGRGLQIRWDDQRRDSSQPGTTRSNRLRSLTVFHGEQLVLKKGIDELRRRSEPSRPVNSLGRLSPAAVQLAATDRSMAVKQAVVATAKKGDIYRAIFADNVTVTQAQQTLATAQQLYVDFLSPRSDDQTQDANTSPARAGNPAATASAVTDDAASSPLKKDVPTVIRWAGPLTVALAPDEPIKPQNADDAVIHLAGSDQAPVHLNDNGVQIDGMWVAYQIANREARVEGSPGHPARISSQHNDRGFQLITPQLRYFPGEKTGKAVLRGPSSAVITTMSKDKPQTLSASWKELAEATLVGRTGDAAISSLHLEGDVNVTHPQIPQFKAGSLDLRFKPAAAGPESRDPVLEQIAASRDVDCILIDRRGQQSHIRCQSLKVAVETRPDGEPYPASIDADGSVYATDGKAYIQGQKIRADLGASGDKKAGDELVVGPNLRNLRAAGQVQIKSAKGELVNADRVQVIQQDGKQHVILEGIPGTPASVQDAQSLLAGNFIEYDGAGETVQITGGGRLVVPDSRKGKTGKGMPIEINWTGPASVSGPKDNVTVDGGVRIHYVDASGMINDAAGDHIDVTLARNLDESASASAGARQMAFLSGKYAKQVVLSATQGRDILLRSLKPGANNTIARQVNILGPRLECYLAPDGKPDRVEIPAPPGGMARMLYVLLPAATRTPVASKDPLQGKNLAGATAFGWKDRLIYDASKGQFIMRGDVLVRHEPQTLADKSFEIRCDTAIADVAVGDREDTAAKAPGDTMGTGDFTRLVLTGRPVQLKRGVEELTSPTVEYDPKTDDVLAMGSQSDPVRVEQGLKTGSFESVRMNLKTNAFDVTGASGQGRRPAR